MIIKTDTYSPDVTLLTDNNFVEFMNDYIIAYLFSEYGISKHEFDEIIKDLVKDKFPEKCI